MRTEPISSRSLLRPCGGFSSTTREPESPRSGAANSGACPFQTSKAGAPRLPSEQLLDLDTLLSALAKADPRAARVVELRFFGGLREEDVAEVLKVSIITVKRDWKAARAWLAARLE